MDYTNKLHIIYGDAALGVQTKKFQYIFSYEKGGLESLKINGSIVSLLQHFGVPQPITIAVMALALRLLNG